MADIVSRIEQTNLNTILRRDYLYWIGLSDLAIEGRFVWQPSLSPLRGYTNWDQGEPNNKVWRGVDEDCVLLWTRGRQGGWGWNDSRCQTNRYALCKS